MPGDTAGTEQTAGPDQAGGPRPGGSSPVGPRRRRRAWLPRVLVAVAALVVVALVAGGIYVYSIDRGLTNNITRADSLPSDDPTAVGSTPRPTRDPQVTGALNYVLLGSDSRDATDAGKGRSDSLMVVHLNNARNKAYIVSFPRDMYVSIPGHGKNKINAAFSFGGPKLTVSTLESLLDVRMDHVALIDFEGFIGLTDDLGGVTVKNTHAFTSHGYRYPKGDITVKGKQALWFVRERHALPGGDLARAANQRRVLKAIVAKGLSKSTLADPAKYLAFITGVAKHLTVDSTLTDGDLRKTALSVNQLSSSDVHLLQAPISGFGTTPGGQSIDVVDRAQLKDLAAALRDDTMDAYRAKYAKR